MSRGGGHAHSGRRPGWNDAEDPVARARVDVVCRVSTAVTSILSSGVPCGLQMPLRQMQIDGGGAEIGVPEQSLHRGQVSAVLDQMGGETVPYQMRAHTLVDARSLRCLPAGLPQNFGGDRLVGAPTLFSAPEQICLGLHPPVVLTERFTQLGIQWHIAVLATLALPDVNDHAPTIDVLHLQ